jgi:hypothetical protein
VTSSPSTASVACRGSAGWRQKIGASGTGAGAGAGIGGASGGGGGGGGRWGGAGAGAGTDHAVTGTAPHCLYRRLRAGGARYGGGAVDCDGPGHAAHLVEVPTLRLHEEEEHVSLSVNSHRRNQQSMLIWEVLTTRECATTLGHARRFIHKEVLRTDDDTTWSVVATGNGDELVRCRVDGVGPLAHNMIETEIELVVDQELLVQQLREAPLIALAIVSARGGFLRE